MLHAFFSGAYDDEEAAAHAYDLAALKYWGEGTILNFPVICPIYSTSYVHDDDMRESFGSCIRFFIAAIHI